MKTNRLSREIVVLAAINFLYCFAVYVTLPILALYFNADLNIPIAQIGIFLGLPPIIGAVFGSFGGFLAKKLGEPNCLIVGISLLTIPYVGYLFVTEYTVLLLLSCVLGLARVFWSPIIKSMFAYHAQKLESQKLAFQINYITICLGAIFGPLVAMVADLSKRGIITISICLLVSVILVLVFSRNLLTVVQERGEQDSVKPRYRLDGLDRRLFFYILAGFLVFFVFSQFEAVFSLALSGVNRNPERLFSMLLILNSVAGIVLQFVVMWLGKKLGTTVMLLCGNLAFAVAFFVFAQSHGNIELLVTATLLFSAGEVLAIPSGDVAINDIAPSDKKALYFSLAEMRTLGFALGPVFASFVLEHYGAYPMFLSSTIVIILASSIYVAPVVVHNNKARVSLSAPTETGKG